MWRHLSKPRPDWRATVEAQGLVYPVTPLPDGGEVDYWHESAWYEFTMAEVETLEAATEELWGMCMEAVTRMAKDMSDIRLGLPTGTLDFARESIRRGDPSVYGRFDLWFDGSTPKMLELNGDTPTGLIETGVTQWNWLEDVMPGVDQWNSVHDRLVARWRDLKAQGAFPNDAVWFLWNDTETSGEEEMTTHYMRDCATQAGLTTFGQPIAHVQWDSQRLGFYDVMGQQITAAYKLYPWELMAGEEFGRHVLGGVERQPVRWIEPAWKVLLSTKALLPVLWEMYPDHPNLLPAYWDNPGPLTDWVAKPLHGREGDNIRIHVTGEDEVQTSDGGYGAEGYVYQQWCPLPSYDGNRPMLGSWVIDGQAAGMIVRESDGPVTDYYSRVCPHAIGDGMMPDAGQVQEWLLDRTPDAKPVLS
jgi:glutathionylspermidine synthase